MGFCAKRRETGRRLGAGGGTVGDAWGLLRRNLPARLRVARRRARANPPRRLAGAGADRARHSLYRRHRIGRGVLLHLAARRARASFLNTSVTDQRVVAIYFDRTGVCSGSRPTASRTARYSTSSAAPRRPRARTTPSSLRCSMRFHTRTSACRFTPAGRIPRRAPAARASPPSPRRADVASRVPAVVVKTAPPA